ncbi:hypothetical protein MTTB_p130 (plasmid) [Methanothermobacter tenebrarum]|uniref:Uncharacterized protein n=1 Tax=Methanothermobacter tenebrarum TaxID=680118 RepID=A0ABM7YFU8_9EURY|nr:hypothetical protein [Methanothermobacter tenebrarum]MBC7128988.1 hypothetical protein [Thermoplasmatales archaeon]BDH80233.1 hypothetical protein MTTB_p130 [Methanothermobacter tenebrarum]
MKRIKKKILLHLRDGEHIAIRYKNIKEYMDLETGHEKIFLEHINPAKEIASEILSKLTKTTRNTIYKKYTTNEIVQEIKKKTKNRMILIIFNDLQQMSKSTMRIFLDILDNIQIFCSIRGKTEKYHMKILEKMMILSSPEDEIIDIKIPIVIFAGTLAFLTYLKIAMGLQGLVAYIILASVWFGTIIARTLLWIAK